MRKTALAGLVPQLWSGLASVPSGACTATGRAGASRAHKAELQPRRQKGRAALSAAVSIILAGGGTAGTHRIRRTFAADKQYQAGWWCRADVHRAAEWSKSDIPVFRPVTARTAADEIFLA